MTKHEHIVSYKTVITVWLLLLMLTGVTVGASRIDLGSLNIWVALGIAAIKSGLVISIFMHMKYESPVFKLFLLIALSVLAIFVGLTLMDVLYR